MFSGNGEPREKSAVIETGPMSFSCFASEWTQIRQFERNMARSEMSLATSISEESGTGVKYARQKIRG